MRELFAGVGAFVLDGGPTLNPSTYELLAGIHAVPAEEVVVLPELANVVMAAERAAELSEKASASCPRARCRPGLAAAVALDPGAAAEANAAAMGEALAPVRTGAVAGAARDDAAEGPRFASATPSASSRSSSSPGASVADAGGRPRRARPDAELVTLIEGEGAPLGGDAVAGLAPDGVELESRARRPAGLLVAARRRVASSATATASTSVRIAVGAGTNASTAPTSSAIDAPRGSTPARSVARAKHAQPIEKAR